MKKILILPFILLSLFCFSQNESMDSATLDAWTRNKDTLPFTHQQIFKNAILSLNKRSVAGGTGLSSLNGLTPSSQTFATGTSGNDFNISSSGSVHTFNVPDANGTTARGFVSTGAQTFGGAKTFSTFPTFSTYSTGQVLVAGLATGTNNLFYSIANQELISNAGSISGPALLLRRDLTSTNPFLTMNNTSDALQNGYFQFTDAGSAGFFPRLIGSADTTVSDTYFLLESRGHKDAGTQAALRFRAADRNGTATLVTKPLFVWENFTTNVMQMEANGNLGIGVTGATSTLTLGGPLAEKYTSTATGITLGTHGIVEVTATGQTITLPTAVGITGREYEIKLTASGSCTVNTTSSQTIDGSTTYSLSAQYKYVRVQSNGANWLIIANN